MEDRSNTSALKLIPWQSFVLLFGMALGVIAIGTIGFSRFEGLGVLDATYASVQTVTTVGYGDVAPRTASGRLFSIILMLSGVGLVLYALTVTAQSVLRSEILAALSERRKLKMMKKLSGHYIVCGAGRVGRRIIANLEREGKKHVVIENDVRHVPNAMDHGRFILGDATSESVLRQAGVASAAGLASCLPDDAANVYVVLTARGLNEKLHIVARAYEEQAEPTLIRAGASRVVAPTIIGSHAMANALTKPAIADLMDSIAAETLDLAFEEIAIGPDSPYAGKALRDTDIAEGLIVVAIRRRNGEKAFHPGAETMIRPGDLLIVIGNAESLRHVAQMNR